MSTRKRPAAILLALALTPSACGPRLRASKATA
ncbi:Uncharacterised protein (plasmid) [Tsukamurella tyrosinosolvens]|uniref:Uncharacterized protein n=1 Tax=Tsukamurella tyrosinosolvens TaxID=57704 RepID=A0A1H4U6A8_TSUTY|nr:hypothetical protein SAMN04489793_2792 [Tsukamurella tyrosinosolvens]VEH94012.1 Uncharacterised protein [Tsukamurella tyrosinosolvens]